ncbi:MAG: hypothetical protein K6D93_08590 [Saccharofermentans sp.]|nr:hypothetical protein [Saccharofermentans sp.]
MTAEEAVVVSDKEELTDGSCRVTMLHPLKTGTVKAVARSAESIFCLLFFIERSGFCLAFSFSRL